MMKENEEKVLEKFANKLNQESYKKYHSCFKQVMDILQRTMNIAEGKEAGSKAMGFKIKELGDIDIIFTIINPKKPTPDIREDAQKYLSDSLKNQAKVTLEDKVESRAVKVHFKEEDVEMDVVFKEYKEYQNEKKLNEHYEKHPQLILNSIILVKYCYYNYPEYKLVKHKIHRRASVSPGNKLSTKVKDIITHCGGGSKLNEIYEKLLNDAREETNAK